MLAIGVLLGGMGAMTWIAGDPGVTMLLGVGQPVQAGLLSILSWIAFLPLTTLTSLGSGAYTSAGTPMAFSVSRTSFAGRCRRHSPVGR